MFRKVEPAHHQTRRKFSLVMLKPSRAAEVLDDWNFLGWGRFIFYVKIVRLKESVSPITTHRVSAHTPQHHFAPLSGHFSILIRFVDLLFRDELDEEHLERQRRTW